MSPYRKGSLTAKARGFSFPVGYHLFAYVIQHLAKQHTSADQLLRNSGFFTTDQQKGNGHPTLKSRTKMEPRISLGGKRPCLIRNYRNCPRGTYLRQPIGGEGQAQRSDLGMYFSRHQFTKSPPGVCVRVLWFLLQRTASDGGLRQTGRIPQQPCVCKRGLMDHPLLKPSRTAQWAQMEHETAYAWLTGWLGVLGRCLGMLDIVYALLHIFQAHLFTLAIGEMIWGVTAAPNIFCFLMAPCQLCDLGLVA